MLKKTIAEKMEELTPGQRETARFILENPKEAAFLTASQVGERVGVSESTVIRFASAIGYDGYPALRSAVKDLLMERLSTLERIGEYTAQEAGSLFHKAIDSDIDSLGSVRSTMEVDAIERLGREIAGAESILVVGHRSSRALAYYLFHYLSWLFPNVELLDSETGLEKITGSGEKTLVIGISFPRYTTWTVDILEYAKRKNLKVAAITNDYSSPLASPSEIVITAPWNPLSFIDSFTAPLSVINCVILAAALTLGEEARNKLAKLEEVWKERGVYREKERPGDFVGIMKNFGKQE
ncbi:MAG: Transcriptional regulator, RpiR family [Synergistales bacterium 53_16]|jgi:DNA-binding MurR/RpiR family transcriptional regulator|nr:MAG: Transcriptional regulator, RpiR family [Synergistales bacterium 53_16]